MAVGGAAPPQASPRLAGRNGEWQPRPRRYTRDEYHRMASAGIFAPDERVELIEGEIVLMAPPGPVHASLVDHIRDVLAGAISRGYCIRAQAPLALGMESDPEPDVAVVSGAWSDYLQQHPTTAVLVIEVAQATLQFDRGIKGSLYAAAGIPEYWVVNLEQETLEVYRDPQPDPVASSGASYGRMERLPRGASVSPLSAPHAALRVDDLLPPPQTAE